MSARVDGIGFSFYTKEQILGVSVKRVTQTPAFDLQGIPVCDSLYDPAMGPLGAMGVCITCGLSSRFCPGHCGHIELPVPIINPLLFSPCFKILQTTCHNCYNFRVRGGQPELDFVKARLRLLDEGRIIEAANLARRADGEYPEVDVLDRDPCNVSLLGNTKRAEILSELNHKLSNSGKCPFCGAHSPKLRSHQKSKVLVEKLSLRMVAHNKALGIDMHPNVFHRREIQDDEAIEIVGRLDQEYKPGDVLDVESEEANDGEEEEIKDEEAAAQRHWMTPLEVEEHLRRVWSRSPRLCSLMFNHLITSEDGRFERIATSHEVLQKKKKKVFFFTFMSSYSFVLSRLGFFDALFACSSESFPSSSSDCFDGSSCRARSQFSLEQGSDVHQCLCSRLADREPKGGCCCQGPFVASDASSCGYLL